MPLPFRPDSIVIAGLGYVGCVSAACLAELGHRVTGVDLDALKVEAVRAGRAPFYEPGLEKLVRDNVAAGRLTASTSMGAALEAADVVLICVGTPSERNGNLGLGQLQRVCEEIGKAVAARERPLIVAVRSTVFPGTAEQVVAPALGHPERVSIVSNPEFLREGAAVRDFIEPSLVVVGGDDRAAVERVAALYAPLNVDPCLVSLRTAELIKYASNAFHALKIAFANEIGALGAELSVDAAEVMATLCRDERLNLSAAYLKPGFAFGGSCLPKDLRALAYRAARLDLKLPLIEAILPANQEHLARAIRSVLDLKVERIGVFGLAFKENTDDLRESPVVALLETLLGKGRSLRVFDPQIRMDQIYGSNQRFILNAIPHIGKLLDVRLEDTLAWAEHLVIAQKPSPEFAQRLRASGLPILDVTASFAAVAGNSGEGAGA
ncbi:MAG TPA: nucleotide sugar dehydrogenase [Bryobacteraceae bacterium]|nr:nucleotide sugar dehydrogenase [Bryobacteraceae bacterium]